MSNQDMFCGDEVPSIIADIGASYSKFGYGGQDTPRFVFSSDMGSVKNAMECSDDNRNKHKIGDSALRVIQRDVEIAQPFANDSIDWEHIELLFKYGIEDCIRVDHTSYPLLLSEGHFTSARSKEMLLELFFERFNLPAAYISPSGTLSSIAAGRPTSLVIDMGATSSRIIPVVDGFTLNNAVIQTDRGGNYMDKQLLKHLQHLSISSQPTNTTDGFNSQINTSHSIASSSTTSTFKQPAFTLHPWFEFHPTSKTYQKSAVTQSFYLYHQNNLIRDMKSYFCSVPFESNTEMTRHDTLKNALTIPPYELPDGNLIEPTESICFLPERLLFDNPNTLAGNGNIRKRTRIESHNSLPAYLQPVDYNTEKDSLSQLVYTAVCKCDIDARRDILNHVLVVGGGALTQGLPQRIGADLTEILPASVKVKISPMTPTERRFSSWIGGSILSICGTFQQMWISKEQYEEYGVNILEGL